jgi:hypothetical protein
MLWSRFSQIFGLLFSTVIWQEMCWGTFPDFRLLGGCSHWPVFWRWQRKC